MNTVPHSTNSTSSAPRQQTVTGGHLSDTPPVTDLLAHWRSVTDRGITIGGWALDRSAAILEYTAGLERIVRELRATIHHNREIAQRAAANHRAEVSALLQRLTEVDTGDGIQGVYERLATAHTETTS